MSIRIAESEPGEDLPNLSSFLAEEQQQIQFSSSPPAHDQRAPAQERRPEDAQKTRANFRSQEFLARARRLLGAGGADADDHEGDHVHGGHINDAKVGGSSALRGLLGEEGSRRNIRSQTTQQDLHYNYGDDEEDLFPGDHKFLVPQQGNNFYNMLGAAGPSCRAAAAAGETTVTTASASASKGLRLLENPSTGLPEVDSDFDSSEDDEAAARGERQRSLMQHFQKEMDLEDVEEVEDELILKLNHDMEQNSHDDDHFISMSAANAAGAERELLQEFWSVNGGGKDGGAAAGAAGGAACASPGRWTADGRGRSRGFFHDVGGFFADLSAAIFDGSGTDTTTPARGRNGNASGRTLLGSSRVPAWFTEHIWSPLRRHWRWLLFLVVAQIAFLLLVYAAFYGGTALFGGMGGPLSGGAASKGNRLLAKKWTPVVGLYEMQALRRKAELEDDAQDRLGLIDAEMNNLNGSGDENVGKGPHHQVHSKKTLLEFYSALKNFIDGSRDLRDTLMTTPPAAGGHAGSGGTDAEQFLFLDSLTSGNRVVMSTHKKTNARFSCALEYQWVTPLVELRICHRCESRASEGGFLLLDVTMTKDPDIGIAMEWGSAAAGREAAWTAENKKSLPFCLGAT
eukprot:g18445.t1